MAWDADQARKYEAEHQRLDTPLTVRYIAKFAKDRDVLEFGVGTGRLAFPLAPVCRIFTGIDNSSDMLAVASESSLPDNVTLVYGDALHWSNGEKYDVVLCVFNFLMQFDAQDEQLEVVRNAAAHLADEGVLIIENMHPPLRAMEDGARVGSLDLMGVDFALKTQRFDWKTFTGEQTTMYVTDGVCTVRRISMRMLLPSEQDLMAHIAGLELVDRIGSWSGGAWEMDPRGPESSNVISIYSRKRTQESQT